MPALLNTVVKCDGLGCKEVEGSTSEVFHNGFVLAEPPDGWVRVGEKDFACPTCKARLPEWKWKR